MFDSTQAPHPSAQRAGVAASLSRRTILQSISGAIVAAFALDLGHASAQAVPPHEFLSVSTALIGRGDLDAIIAQRLFVAMCSVFPNYTETVSFLHTLIKAGDTPKDILNRAEKQGRADAVHDLVAAWYIGTANQKMNAPMVAYYDALMYRPTRDALPVPTYCFAEPGWWTQTPPALGIPVVAPKPVPPPAPPPVGVEAKPPAAAPLRPHLPHKHKES